MASEQFTIPEPKAVLDHLRARGMPDEQPFTLAQMALHACGDDWTEAHEELVRQQHRFLDAGDETQADALYLASRILLFYGRGY